MHILGGIKMNELKTICLEESFYEEVKNIMMSARYKVYRSANSAMVEAYWLIGKRIVEKQGGETKAKYGDALIKELSIQMTKDFGKGYTVSNLRKFRQFYLFFPIRSAVWSELTWSHYRALLKVKDEDARNFYMNECVKSNWSTRQLERQINTMYYERLLSSQDKKSVANEIYKYEPESYRPEDIIKDPYVLEFAGLKANVAYYETKVENALIEHMQSFLLELGRGFSFVSRQQRISFDRKHFYIDLVFYNYILKCFVLIDIKTGELTHQDIGQMQMYVNYYTRELRNDGDNPPIGIILCADKNETVVKYTLPEGNNQIFTSKYQFCLPTDDELRKELNEQYELYNSSKQ